MLRRPLLLLLAFTALIAFAQAWQKEDHEIFRLRDEVIEHEGQNVTFYDVLGVKRTASQTEIKSARKKKGLRLHPDKAIPAMIAKREAPRSTTKSGSKKPGPKVHKGVSQKERAQITKEANERYARFRTIADVLQGEGRERYDHFLRNGFPTWKGTGYYYARFRPGLGSVMIGLMVVFGGFAHYGAMYISWKRQREFVQRYVSHARKMAWGNESGIPNIPSVNGGVGTAAPPPQENDEQYAGALNRRQKRMQEKDSKKKDNTRVARTARSRGISKPVDGEAMDGPQGSKKKVIAENGKVLIVDSVGNVFLEETTEEGQHQEFLLDPDEIPKPTILQTALFRLPVFMFNQTIGRGIDKIRGTSEMADEDFLDQEGTELTTQMSPQANADGAIETATALNPQQEARKRRAKS